MNDVRIDITGAMERPERPNIVMHIAYGLPTYTDSTEGTSTHRAVIGRDADGQLWQFQTKQFTDRRGMAIMYEPTDYVKIYRLPPRNTPGWWFNPHYAETESADHD